MSRLLEIAAGAGRLSGQSDLKRSVSYIALLSGLIPLLGAATETAPSFVYDTFPDARVRVNCNEAAIPPYALEDPLTFADGTAVRDAADWARRRAEILGIFAREMYGKRPPEPETLATDLVEEKLVEDGTVICRRHEMFFRADRTGRKISWTTFLPKETSFSVPVIVLLHPCGEPSLAPSNGLVAVRRGYAVVSACGDEVSPDPEITSLGEWSWMLSRGLDLAARQPEIDARHSVVTGCGRLGTSALLAAAHDERFSVCVPVQTGKGGAALAKRDFGDNPGTLIRTFAHGFCRAYAKYTYAPWASLTFDQHLLLASLAPRALLVLGFDDPRSDPRGEFLACRAARGAWERGERPKGGEPTFRIQPSACFFGARLGYAHRSGVRGMTVRDWTWLLDFADVQFGRRTSFPQEPVGREDYQAAIDAAARQGGGRVTVTPGRHLTGGLVLKSNVELHLAKGAVLEGSPRTNDYPGVELPCSEGRWMAVVMAVGATNVAVTGEGEIYGNGTAFPRTRCKLQEGTRPRGLFFGNCRGVRLMDFTLRDAGCWGGVVQCCEDVEIRRLRIDSHANWNNDGLDIEARNVLVEGCDIDSGDDGICLKSNNPDFAVENVLVTNCTIRSFCVPLKIGTATHGIVRNVLFADCRTEAPRRDFSIAANPLEYRPFFWRGWRAIRDRPGLMTGEPSCSSAIAIECVDGGWAEGVTLRNIRIEGGCSVPIFVRAHRRTNRATGARRGGYNILRNILFENISGYALSALPSSVTGIPSFRVCDVTFRNVHLVSRGIGDYASLSETDPPEQEDCTPGLGMFAQALPASGLWARHVDNLKLEDTTFRTDTRECIVLEDVR